MKDIPFPHGTTRGYILHYRAGETACAKCKRAWRLYYRGKDKRA